MLMPKLSLLHSHSPVRIFAFSTVLTIAAMAVVLYFFGPVAALVALALIVLEMSFSFDNAIINAKVLKALSPFWQKMFLTIGILIAVFGMRIIFPIAIVALTASIPWREVLDLALNNPEQYEHALESAMPTISAFGGMFLAMLALHFFFDSERKVSWLTTIEKPMQRFGKTHKLFYALAAFVLLGIVTLLPFNPHPKETFVAGLIGIVSYAAIHGFTMFLEHRQRKTDAVIKTGLAGFLGFMYLEVLDASFSLDGVIGAFAITSMVVIIAIGLGVGAIWVRSMTVYLVRRGTLDTYRFLEHGAHYAIALLALILLAHSFIHVPEFVTSLSSIAIIMAAFIASLRYNRRHGHTKAN